MRFRSLRKPIAAILMLSMATTTSGYFAQSASAKGVSRGVSRGGADVVIGIIDVVKALKNDDKEKRAAFTQRTVDELVRKYPDYNFVITRYKQSKTSGQSIIHHHVEMNQHVGTVGYEIYAAPKGKPFKFSLNGDGDFINWAFRGDFNRNGNTLTAK